MKEKTLVIFYKNGKTAYFKHVTNFDDTGTYIIFDYIGQTTQLKRHAHFSRVDSLAGYAFEIEEEGHFTVNY